MSNPPQRSSYLDHLPGIYEGKQDAFLNGFLLAFEHVLSGRGTPSQPAPGDKLHEKITGLEEMLDGVRDQDGQWLWGGIERHFAPLPYLSAGERTSDAAAFQAPKEFLDWLATWVALDLRMDLSEADRRKLISKAMYFYCLRGTKAGLEKLLKLLLKPFHLTKPIRIQEPAPFQLRTDNRPRLGVDTWLGDNKPHFFRVIVWLDSPEPEQRRRIEETVKSIVDVEKPAHTYYLYQDFAPTFQLGRHSRLAKDTLLDVPHPEYANYKFRR